MEVEVRLFAMLRECAGSQSVTVELRAGATVRDAIEAVARRPGMGELIARMPVVMAVNREYAAEDAPLGPGDELALIPPVSGGESDTAASAADDAAGGFESGPGYEAFMRLVGNQVPGRPGY